MGITNGNAELEGTIGGNLEHSSNVQAIFAYYPATNLVSILDQSTPFGLNVRVPALEALLGGPMDETAELARLASPVFHVDTDDPPPRDVAAIRKQRQSFPKGARVNIP